MNKDIMRKAGFSNEVEAVEHKICPMCNNPINIDRFRDRLSIKEYSISGLCQACQDKIFGI
jgi:hypothetical protein